MPPMRAAMRPALLVWGFLLMVRPASGELTGVSIRAENINLPGEVLHAVQRGAGSTAKACEMEPAEFLPSENFYVVTCMHTAVLVDLVFSGGSLYRGDADGGGDLSGNMITVEMPQYEEPHIKTVVSCPNGTWPSSSSSHCTTYTFDVFRKGGDIATLSMMGVASSGVQPTFLSPDFDPHVMEYSTEVSLGTPFSITAGSSEFSTLVGIEYASASVALSGLGDQDGCHLGIRKHMRWDLPGFQSVGEHMYTVCAIAPDHNHMLKYKLKVTVVPPYSEELSSIKVSPYELTAKFDPKVNVYEVRIPQELYKERVEVTISAKANDTEATIRFTKDGDKIGEAKHGENSVKVKTNDNQNLKDGETPQWTQAVNIKVTSADDRKSKSYMVKVRQEVSTYCKLKDITVGSTNCTLEQIGLEGAEVVVGFDKNHSRYKCVFDYMQGESPHIVAVKDMEKCSDCEIRVPDPFQHPESHLSLSYWLLKRIRWDELHVDEHKQREWTRKFLFGEYHTLPIQVISADKFTDCTYEVYIERWAPWYMRVSTTRLISKTSMTLSWLMSLTGAANVMALAKQVQFMSLTTEIDNVPQVYKDYAHTLKAFNLDITPYLPDLGLPTKEDFKRYKEKMIAYIRVHTGIQNARLLTQYCYAKNAWGMVGANAILHEHPEDTQVLLQHKDEGFKCKSDSAGLCKKIAEEKAKKKKEELAKEAAAEEAKDKASEGSADRRLEALLLSANLLAQPGKSRTSAAMLRGASGNFTSSPVSLRILSDVGADPDHFFRRLDESDKSDDNDKKDKDKDKDKEKDKEEEEEKYPDVWQWPDKKWRKFIKKAAEAGVTESSYPAIPCKSPLINQVVTTLAFVHNLELLREMLHSTTGEFLIIFFGIVFLGSTYGAYWTFFMKDNQRRPKVLEPGQFWIFVMDYALIGFSKNAAQLCFRESLITFFFFQPQRWMTQTFCIFALICYPLAFTIFVMWSICTLTGAYDGREARLVYNSTREQWLDPACNDIRVTIEPKIPRSVPMIPQLITKHVRACVPILNQEGEKLKFDEDMKDENGKTRGALQNESRAQKKMAEMEGKSKHQEELKRMDQAIQDELAVLASSHNTKHMEARKQRLKKEAEHAQRMEEWNRAHEEEIKERRARLRREVEDDTQYSDPPWFAIVATAEHEQVGRKSWFGGQQQESEDVRLEAYSNIKVSELVDKWEPFKGRADNETLDAEEKFAVLQYIETALREEKKLLKYNILSVIMEHGYLTPREPIKLERKVMMDKTVAQGDVGLSIKMNGKQCQVVDVSDGSWAASKSIQANNRIVEIGDGKRSKAVSDMSEDEIQRRLKSERPLELTLQQGAPEGQKPNRHWLPTKDDYLRDDLADYGQHPWLEEYTTNSSFIENDRGERLVYEGNSRSFFGWIKTGRGMKSGKCSWMSEPDSGWAIWEMEHLADRGAQNSTMRYADKWQRIIFDFPDIPWDKDEEGEDTVKICGLERCAFKKTSIPLFQDFRKAIFQHYRERVPSRVPVRDKVEIRKWLWTKLKPPMEMKLKLSYLADQHPKFYRENTLLAVSKKDFHQVMFEIETAKPNDEWMEEFGRGHRRAGSMASKMSSTASEKSGDGSNRQNGSIHQNVGVQTNPHELLEYTLMKFEDLYGWDEEPWWSEADERAKARGQVKVMFDHETFWKCAGDPQLDELRKNNSLVPPNGYHSSTMFMEHSGEVVGTKRYSFVKPDNSLTPVSCNLTMGHVLPLMRYTNRFKANVPIDSLDLPHRSAWQIVLADKKKGEEFNYCMDRSTTLISIICVSAKAGGLETALIFLCMKLITLVNQIWTSFKAAQGEEKPAQPAVEEERQPLLGRGLSRSGTNNNLKAKVRRTIAASKERLSSVWKGIKQVDVGVLFLQCATLLILFFGQPKLPDGIRMHENLCAFICIIVCSFTMVFMNVFTASAEFKKLIEEWTGWLKQLNIARRSMMTQVKEFAAGENPLGIQFITMEQSSTDQVQLASKVAVVIPELGIHFEGTPDIDDGMPLDEQRQMQLLKKVSFFSLNRENKDDVRPKSIRDHPRFEADLSDTLAVALSIDQMMMYAKIPQIVATIQCVNHTNSSLTKAQYDNYLTLFKPDDWEPEFEYDSNRVEKMLQDWKEQVHVWFKESLGAVESERTCTEKIKEQLFNMLRKECTGALHRDLLCVSIGDIFLPAKGIRQCQDLTDKLGYVTVLYENERITVDFPTNRMSHYAKFKKYTPPASALETAAIEHPEEAPEDEHDKATPRSKHSKQHRNLAMSIAINSEILMEVPVGVTKVRLALWVQLPGKNEEELVAFSSDIDIFHMAESRRTSEPLEFFMHNKWTHARGRRLAPYGGEDEEEAEKRRRLHLSMLEEAAKSSCRRWCDRFKATLKRYLSCQCFRSEPTEEQIKLSKGVVTVKARRANAKEIEHDLMVLMALKDVTQGESSLNLSKLERHMDRYVELSEFFGVYLQEVDVANMRAHIERMRAVHKELWPTAERRKSVEEREKGTIHRQSKVLEQGIRRQLEGCEEMEKAIDFFDQQIAKVEKRIQEHKSQNIVPIPPYFITKKKVSGWDVWKGNADRVGDVKDKVVSNVLLDELVKYRLMQVQSARSIVHYIVISDHLKPGKNWRPDTIVPHVASIVTNDFEDIPEVLLTGGQKRGGKQDVTFQRQLKSGTKDEPVVLNGRMVYKAVESNAVFAGHSGDVWLYWDGRCRWVISPFYGMPAPYGLSHEEGKAETFMWNKDPATTPDAITNTWMVWGKSKKSNPANQQQRWEKDPLMKVIGKNQQTRRARRTFEGNITTLDEQQGPQQEGIGSMVTNMMVRMFRDAFSEVLNLFTLVGHQKTDPCLHECLISIDSKYLSFAWKDFAIERLAPFRKFLLTEFGTYQSAWVFITRKLSMPRSMATKNLANIFKSTMELIELDEREEKELEDQRRQEMQDLEGMSSPVSPLSDKTPGSRGGGSLFGFGGGRSRSSRQKKASQSLPSSAAASPASAVSNADDLKKDQTLGTHASLSSYGTIRSQCSRFNPEVRAKLKQFLTKKRTYADSKDKDKKKKKGERAMLNLMGGKKASPGELKYDRETEFEQLADHVMGCLDRSGDGMISVEEMNLLYDEDPTEEILKEFAEWLLSHPMYRDIEYFWEPFSDGLEITLEEFTDATERIMLKFPSVKHEEATGVEDPDGHSHKEGEEHQEHEHQNICSSMTPAEKAEQLFTELDAQNMSGGISFQEIRPFSGERFEDADRSMLRFQIPLTHVKEIICQGHVSKFSDDKRCLRFHINNQFENSRAWRDFRTALNPDWEPAPNNESVQICMATQFYDLWRQVIKTSEMVTPQEWIRYYDGEYKEHPIITGTYMRHGEGTQRWSNAQIYVGSWQNHVYDGQGRLWDSVPDFESGKPPIYSGGWLCGKQHGMGTMRYKQDLQDRRGKAALTRGQHAGISKIYRGCFRNGLFHGRGRLAMEKAVAQHMESRSRVKCEENPGFVPLPLLDPATIIDFDGEFESDWATTNDLVRRDDPVFDSRNPRIMFVKQQHGLFRPSTEKVERMDLKLEELTKYDTKDDRFTRFFAVDTSRVQKAGQALPDLALAAYQQRGGDALHMAWSINCRYADGTEYVGRLENGKPHTLKEDEEPAEASTVFQTSPTPKSQATLTSSKVENAPEAIEEAKERYGTTTQYEVLPNGERGPFLAEYCGEFVGGKRHGFGCYETWDGLNYKGQWADNKRHGEGMQILAEKLQSTYGYSEYKGEWKDDMKSGHGSMRFGERGLLLYEGGFVDDLREGKGFIYLTGIERDKDTRSKSKKSTLTEEQGGDRIVVYNGSFRRDVPYSTDAQPIWSHLVVPGDVRGRFFYGRLDEEGKRVGVGTVYDEDADECQEFLDCFSEGRRYDKEDVSDPFTWKYITYHGNFSNDLPHGTGVQHFFDKNDKRKSGIYKGQFVDGQRHGRGTWSSKDDTWKYRPIEASHVANWDRDLMHGIAIVEDRDHVHENVVYTHGRCQMPFTDMGPPLTGFDNTVLVGSLVKVGRMAKKAATSGYGPHGPQASIASNKKKYGLFGFGREDHDQGVNAIETKAVQLMNHSAVVTGKKNNKVNAAPSPVSRTEEEEDMEAMAMVREETDLTMPEEDVMISGGTGENEVLNGLYFKLSGTYGQSIYKLAKQSPAVMKAPNVRYLFKDIKTKCWVIAPKPLGGIIQGPACAFVEDEEAERPGGITAEWYVWYPPKKSMKSPQDEDEEEAVTGVDRLTAVSIVGFEILGIDKTKVKPGLLLRHGRDLYGRPVYEAESGGQFLYWMRNSGSLPQGMLEDDTEFTGGVPDHRKLFSHSGAWIIANEVGEAKEGPTCLAWVDDIAVTPDQINPRATWHVAVGVKSKKDGGYVYESRNTVRTKALEF